MIVCICKAISGKEIKEWIDKGHQDLESLGQVSGAGTDCGCCKGKIDKMLDSAPQTQESSPSAPDEKGR